MMGMGNPKIICPKLMINVFRTILGNSVLPRASGKFEKPAQGLPRIPSRILYVLKAIRMPYNVKYLKIIKYATPVKIIA
jgi:hypothetical protein